MVVAKQPLPTFDDRRKKSKYLLNHRVFGDNEYVVIASFFQIVYFIGFFGPSTVILK